MIESEKSMRLLGVVRRNTLLEISSARTEAQAKDLMEDPKLSLDPEIPIHDALTSMIRLDEWYAPVIDDFRHYMGMLGLEDAIRYIIENCEEKLMTPVSDAMQRNIVYIEPDTPIPRVWQLMRHYGFAALPVVRDGVIIGVITEYDLLIHGFTRPDFESDNYRKGPLVREVMSTPPITLTESGTLLDAARLMLKHDIGRVYITDESKKLVGVIDRSDVVSSWL